MEQKQITIGGSEIAAVMGLSRWTTPLKLWAEKTGKVEREDISGKEFVELGTELEEFVARRFTKLTGIAVRRDRKAYTHPKYPYLVGHIDRNVTGTDAVLECKTASAYKLKEWEGDDIPIEYVLQLNWYLGLTQSKVGHIAVLIGGQKFRYKQIEYDAELFEKQVAAAVNFVEYHCAEDIPPMAVGDDNDFLKELYPREVLELIETTDREITMLIDEIEAIKKEIILCEKQQNEKESTLKAFIGDCKGIIAPDYNVTWKAQTSTRIDTAAIKAAGLYDQYSKTTETRVLRITKNKGAK